MSAEHSRRDSALRAAALTAFAALAIAAVYFPVAHAQFVWDDRIYLHDLARLRSGSGWLRHAFGPIFDSGDYFRPLCILLFAAETELFDVAAGPAHLISLALHVANALLVALLSRQLLAGRAAGSLRWLPIVAMLLYGLHPLLIEPVAWVSGQFELVVTLFMLLGLVSNLALADVRARSVAVAACFFLAACAKESAVAFPLLLLTIDHVRPANASGPVARRGQWPVYGAVLAAGLLYLLLRRWGMGYLVQSSGALALFSWQRLQLVCYTYVTYWRVMLWPMSDLGPLHVIPYARFATLTAAFAVSDVIAIAIAAFGALQLRRRRALGALIVGASMALLPMLHVLPIEFDDSFYHDRYAMSALAIACALVPSAFGEIAARVPQPRLLFWWGGAACALWLAGAAVNIRVTLPLWSNETTLFRWILRDQPESVEATNSLLARYLAHGDLQHARPLVDMLKVHGRDCTNCMVDVANFAIMSGDVGTATAALKQAREATRHWAPTRVQILGFIMTTGDLKALQGDLVAAEQAYRDAIVFDPLVAGPHFNLAMLLVREGRVDDARRESSAGVALAAPDEAAAQRARFEAALAEARSASRAPAPAPSR